MSIEFVARNAPAVSLLTRWLSSTIGEGLIVDLRTTVFDHVQRMPIARLLLGRARVAVLDEATASLDSTSEAAVQQALSEALAGRTSIVIAHRLSTVRAADVSLVEDGRIVERGTHEQLLTRGGRYAELYLTQFGDDTAAA
jgi:ABC-type multidrug transport system fused ATPase/permease subunit